jgi:hypothetical protein
MRVRVTFVGVLSSFLGTEEATFDLSPGSRREDLLAEIGRVYGPDMPEQLWNEEEKTFNGPILATRDARSLTSIGDSELVEDDEIQLFFMAAGG